MQILGVECLDPEPSIDEMFGYIVNWSPPPYYVGHNFKFACRSHQILRGASNRTCLANGRWSGLDTVCDDEPGNCNSQFASLLFLLPCFT